MLPTSVALDATKGVFQARQFASQAANVLNTADSVINKLLPEGEGEMESRDEITYTTLKTVLTHNVMIELQSNNLAKELLRPDQRNEVQSFITRMLFSCCCPPKPLLSVRISDHGLQDALNMARDPVFTQTLTAFRRVTTGMGETISQAAWVSQLMVVLMAQVTQDSSATNIQSLSLVLKAVAEEVMNYYKKPRRWLCLPAIESQEVLRLYEACEQHKTIFETFAGRVPEFDWPLHYQQLSGYLNSLSKSMKEKIASQIAPDKNNKIRNSLDYAVWQISLAKSVGGDAAEAMMMSLNEHDNFKSLVRANREMLFQVGDSVDEGVVFYVTTINHLVDFLLDCLEHWKKNQSKGVTSKVQHSLWWLNLTVDLSLAMINGVSENSLFNTPFSRAILDNTNKRLQQFRRLDQQNQAMPFLSESIGSIAEILGHNDKQFNSDNPVMTAISRILLSDHNQYSIQVLVEDLRSIIHYAFSSHRSDRSVFFQEKMQFRLYAAAHQLIYDDYKRKARSQIRISPFAKQVDAEIANGFKKINNIDHMSLQCQGRSVIDQCEDEFKQFIEGFKQMMQSNLAARGRSITKGGYAYSFLMVMLRWSLAYLEPDKRQEQHGRKDLPVPCPLEVSRLIQNSSSDLFKKPTHGSSISNTDIRIDLALSHGTVS